MSKNTEEKLQELELKSNALAHDMLHATAQWLEDPDNEVFCLLEDNESSMTIAAEACVAASMLLKKASLDIQLSSGIEYSRPGMAEAVDSLKSVADGLDESGNPQMQKLAGVLDEIMLTIAADVDSQKKFKESVDRKIADIKRRMNGGSVEKKAAGVKNAQEHVDISLSTRYCPDHPGVQTFRKEENTFQCPLDGKTYDYSKGYTTMNGTSVPGGTVDQQTDMDSFISNPLSSEGK